MKAKGVKLEYLVGTMIEVPRAALTAGRVAEVAEFFSFGTNDLTQMTYGYSRDDAGKFLPEYVSRKILPGDPFVSVDQEGVGMLMEWAVENGRKTRAQAQGRHLRRARWRSGLASSSATARTSTTSRARRSGCRSPGSRRRRRRCAVRRRRATGGRFDPQRIRLFCTRGRGVTLRPLLFRLPAGRASTSTTKRTARAHARVIEENLMQLRVPAFDRYPLGWLAVLAAVLGVAVVRLLPLDPHANPDSWAFEAIARSLLAGHGFTYREPMLQGLDLYAFRAPGYSVLVALGLLLGGVGSVIVLQGALNGISAALVGQVAGRLAGPRAAWIAFALRLAWPAGWGYARAETSEILFEFLGVLATWLVIESIERRHVGWSLVAGAACAAAILTRPVGIANAGVLALGLWLRFPRAAVAFALTILVGWAAWPVRNVARLHAFVPFSTLGGATAWAGTTENGEVGPAFTGCRSTPGWERWRSTATSTRLPAPRFARIRGRPRSAWSTGACST